LLHKIIVLIFNMFIYVKVGHSKLVFYFRHRVNITFEIVIRLCSQKVNYMTM
jgi:hypothetical protein